MTQLPCCACCAGPLEPAQQLRFLVETDTLDNPAFLARIRMMPSVNGRPVPVCKPCQARLEAAPRVQAKPQQQSSVAVLVGVLSIGLVLGALFATRG